MQQWANSPIAIDRNLDGDIYHIRASDGYKETKVADRIEIGSRGNWKLYAVIGAVAFLAGGAVAAFH